MVICSESVLASGRMAWIRKTKKKEISIPNQPLRQKMRSEDSRADPSGARLADLWQPATLIGLAVLLRLPGLGESLWSDEVNYSTSSGVSSPADLWSYIVHKPEAPLYRILLFLWNAVAGDHEIVVRLPSLVSGILCVGLTWHLARICCGRPTALLAALLLSLSPVHVWYSQEATPYSMTLLFLLAATVIWLRLIREGTGHGWFTAYCGLILAAVFTHYYAAAFLLPLSLLALRAQRPVRRWILAANFGAGACVVLVLGAKLVSGHLLAGLGYLRPFTLFELWMLLLHWFPTGNTIWRVGPYGATAALIVGRPQIILCQLAILALLLHGLGVIFRNQADSLFRWALPLALTTLPVALLVTTVIGFDHLYIERYLLFLLPFYVIAVARGATAFTSSRTKTSTVLFVVGLSIAAWTMLQVRDDVWTVYKQNPNWRAAARLLKVETVERGDGVAFCYKSTHPVAHYLRRDSARGPKARRYRKKAVEQMVANGNVKTLYLIRNRYWDSGFNHALEFWSADRRLRAEGAVSVKGVDIHIFTLTSAKASSDG